MLGNDIIDLPEVLASGQARRPKFQNRICWASEVEPLQAWFSDEHCTWLLWAIKESAYKYYIQSGGQPLFAPKKFRFKALKIEAGLVEGHTETPLGKVQSEAKLAAAHLTTESWSLASHRSSIHRKIFPLSASKQIDKSSELKYLICQQWMEKFGNNTEAVCIKKDKHQVPHLYQKGQKLPYAISLSHHGAWGFFSYQKENSPSLG